MNPIRWEHGSIQAALAHATWRPVKASDGEILLAGEEFDALMEEIARTHFATRSEDGTWGKPIARVIAYLRPGEPDFPIEFIALLTDGSMLVARPRAVHIQTEENLGAFRGRRP